MKKQRTPYDMMYDRLIGMMKDYGISLAESIHWDMEGFMPHPRPGFLSLEEEVHYYLSLNRVTGEHGAWLFQLAVGAVNDYGLTEQIPDEGDTPEAA